MDIVFNPARQSQHPFRLFGLHSDYRHVSAFNGNTVIAYIITIFVLWGFAGLNLDFLIAPAQNLSDEIAVRIIRSLNFNKHYQDFVSGQAGLDNVIYFISVIVPALWLNVVALEYKKK